VQREIVVPSGLGSQVERANSPARHGRVPRPRPFDSNEASCGNEDNLKPAMRDTTLRIVAITLTLCLAIAFPALGQVHERYEGWCYGLQNASAPDLLEFLNAVVPAEWNARCITWAIHKLGKEHHEPAIPRLVKLLDFRLPLTPKEEMLQGTSQAPFPAEEALAQIGKKALPEVLRAIEADSTSAIARENALSVWMEIYRESDEQPKAVSLLKQEETKVSDNAMNEKLRLAVQKALTYCNPLEEIACEEAAKTGNSEQVPRGQ
jgi:hypothetical protein